jgi:hypothetical protein
MAVAVKFRYDGSVRKLFGLAQILAQSGCPTDSLEKKILSQRQTYTPAYSDK